MAKSAGDYGKIIGWGGSNKDADVKKTITLTKKLTKKDVEKMIADGLDKKFVVKNLQQYKAAITKAEEKLNNKQLFPRRDLMAKILKLWP